MSHFRKSKNKIRLMACYNFSIFVIGSAVGFSLLAFCNLPFRLDLQRNKEVVGRFKRRWGMVGAGRG